jgi:hypothetical protein
MHKRTILWLTLLSILLAIVGVVLIVPNVSAAASHCTQQQVSNGACHLNVSPAAGTAIGIGAVLEGAAALLHLIAWIAALVRSARMRTWAWLLIVLLLGTLGLLIYALVGPPDPARPAEAPAPPSTAPGYPPPAYPPPNAPAGGYPPYNYPPPGSDYPPPGSGYPPNAPTVPG